MGAKLLDFLATIGALLLAAAFVVIQAARVATSGEPIGPTYADQTTHRTATAIGWPVLVVFGVLVTLPFLV
jgi:hypothetical protein